MDDSDPFDGSQMNETETKAPGRRTSMSFATALSLSLNNLMTKKARTFLTAFAGSIGIIGIALIMSLSSGVQAYINGVERDTLSRLPDHHRRQLDGHERHDGSNAGHQRR